MFRSFQFAGKSINLNTSSSSLVSTPLIKSMSQVHLDLIRKSTSKSLLDEYTNTFSATKTPLMGKRRTIAHITMDIIKQRVENINRNVSSNMSMNEALDDSMSGKTIQTPIQSVSEKNDDIASSKTAETEKPKPVGRRLFAPPSLFPENSPLLIPTPTKTDKKTASKSATKRKRDDLLVEKPTKASDQKKARKPPRRSTMFFEEAPIKKTNSSETENQTVESNSTDDTALPVLVCTSMHQPQIDFVNEVRQC